MPDARSGLDVLGASKFAAKLLGPTAEYVGEDVKSWPAHRVENLERVFDKARHKVDADELEESGAVSPRILRGVLEEGSFAEDELAAEYFAGVLASSRSTRGGDDRGAAAIEVLDALSKLQLRAHYVLYRGAQAIACAHPDVDFHVADESARLVNLAVQSEQFADALISEETGMTFMEGMTHIMSGLARAELIDGVIGWATGTPDVLRKITRPHDWPGHCTTFTLSTFGIEMFCAAHGFTAQPLSAFQRPSSDFETRWTTDMPACEVLVVADLPPYEPSAGARRGEDAN